MKYAKTSLKVLLGLFLVYVILVIVDSFDYPYRWTEEALKEIAENPERTFSSQLGESSYWSSVGDYKLDGKYIARTETWDDSHPFSQHFLTLHYTKETSEVIYFISYRLKSFPIIPTIPIESGTIKIINTQPVAGGDATR